MCASSGTRCLTETLSQPQPRHLGSGGRGLIRKQSQQAPMPVVDVLTEKGEGGLPSQRPHRGEGRGQQRQKLACELPPPRTPRGARSHQKLKRRGRSSLNPERDHGLAGGWTRPPASEAVRGHGGCCCCQPPGCGHLETRTFAPRVWLRLKRGDPELSPPSVPLPCGFPAALSSKAAPRMWPIQSPPPSTSL